LAPYRNQDVWEEAVTATLIEEARATYPHLNSYEWRQIAEDNLDRYKLPDSTGNSISVLSLLSRTKNGDIESAWIVQHPDEWLIAVRMGYTGLNKEQRPIWHDLQFGTPIPPDWYDGGSGGSTSGSGFGSNLGPSAMPTPVATRTPHPGFGTGFGR
jgi:hypothetical protein